MDLISDAPSVQKYFENLLKIVGNYVDIAKQIDDNIYVRKNDSKQHKGQNDEELNNQRHEHDKRKR